MRGFTIIEILLVVTFLIILVMVSAPLYYSFSVGEQLNTEAQQLLQTLRRAQTRAMAGEADLKFGIFLSSNQYILFAGNSYATRDSSYDEVYDLPATLTLSWSLGGPSEVVFNKLKGTPSATGTVTLTDSNSQSQTVSINTVGKVEL